MQSYTPNIKELNETNSIYAYEKSEYQDYVFLKYLDSDKVSVYINNMHSDQDIINYLSNYYVMCK